MRQNYTGYFEQIVCATRGGGRSKAGHCFHLLFKLLQGASITHFVRFTQQCSCWFCQSQKIMRQNCIHQTSASCSCCLLTLHWSGIPSFICLDPCEGRRLDQNNPKISFLGSPLLSFWDVMSFAHVQLATNSASWRGNLHLTCAELLRF